LGSFQSQPFWRALGLALWRMSNVGLLFLDGGRWLALSDQHFVQDTLHRHGVATNFSSGEEMTFTTPGTV